MSRQLIDHNPDLKRLRDEGYELEISGGYLFIHHVPYVNHGKNVLLGSLCCQLDISPSGSTVRPNSHVMYFTGDVPCDREGRKISAIYNSSPDLVIREGLVANHLFSSKPAIGFYMDYYEKVTTYIRILGSPASSIDKNATAQTYRLVEDKEEDVFQYVDTHSSRANINHLNQRFEGLKIGIIGLGGTGSYILDHVAKTRVREIHLYDGDDFLQHNAFRSPGAAPIEWFKGEDNLKKVRYYTEMYSRMHKGIEPHEEYITEVNIEQLRQMSYVFICVDNSQSRTLLVNHLLNYKVPFIDVGLGIHEVDGSLMGILRVTAGTPEKNDHLIKRIPTEDFEENDYTTNIQISDLNAINANLAVIMWKKMVSFYQDLMKEHNITYTINTSQLLKDDLTS